MYIVRSMHHHVCTDLVRHYIVKLGQWKEGLWKRDAPIHLYYNYNNNIVHQLAKFSAAIHNIVIYDIEAHVPCSWCGQFNACDPFPFIRASQSSTPFHNPCAITRPPTHPVRQTCFWSKRSNGMRRVCSIICIHLYI